jgi:hypothetical protein
VAKAGALHNNKPKNNKRNMRTPEKKRQRPRGTLPKFLKSGLD